jgi:putative acetyltransferase
MERPDTSDARALINELDQHLLSLYPLDSHHGLTVEELLVERVAFFLTRFDDMPAGCGGVQFFGKEYGEIKRMYVRPRFRGRGLGKLMLKHLMEYSLAHGIRVLRLETGIYQVEAIGLYERMGFRRIFAFGEYEDDPLSRYYEKLIN